MGKKTTLIFSFFVFLFGCGRPEIKLLCNNAIDGNFNEIYLVNNPPNDEDALKKLIIQYNRDLRSNKQFGRRTFLRNHNNNIFEIAFGETINYSKNGCDEIDNMDIICDVSKINFQTGGDTIIYNFYSIDYPNMNIEN